MAWIRKHLRAHMLLRLLPLCAALALLAGCGPVRVVPANGPVTRINVIKYNGVSYTSVDAAVAAMRQTDEGYIADLPHETDPILGHVRIILPDSDRLRPFVAQQKTLALKRPVVGEALEGFIEEDRAFLMESARALLASGEFASGRIVEQNDVLNPEQGDADYLVWFQVRTMFANNTGVWIAHWMVRRKGSLRTAMAAFDTGTAVGVPRYESFIKSVRQAALTLGGRSRAGITANNPRAGLAPTGTVAASGIIIDTRGHILTNDHVVRGCDGAAITDEANHHYKASIVARDAANDLALLEARHRWPEAATLRDGPEAKPGDRVVVAGYPLTGLLGSSAIVTTGSLSALAGLQDDSRFIQVSAPIQPGNSGGAVLDAGGRVLGIVDSTLNGMAVALLTGTLPQNVNFAVKSVIIRNFLDTHGIAYAHAPPGPTLAGGEVGTLARRFTVRVSCDMR